MQTKGRVSSPKRPLNASPVRASDVPKIFINADKGKGEQQVSSGKWCRKTRVDIHYKLRETISNVSGPIEFGKLVDFS